MTLSYWQWYKGYNRFYMISDKKFSIIYADPPWDYQGGQMVGKDGKNPSKASHHYKTMKLKDLKQLPVHEICEENCLLFMWTSSPHLDQAIELGKAWGFSYKTVAFVWNKMKVNPGWYTMSQCELCLVFKKGKIPLPRGLRNVRQLIECKRGRHSEKPLEARDRIHLMFPEQHKIELFARPIELKNEQNWSYWGDEVKNTQTDQKSFNLEADNNE